MTRCMEVRVLEAGVIEHRGSGPEEWQQVLYGAAAIKRLEDINWGEFTALYQVRFRDGATRQYLVAEPLRTEEVGSARR